MDSSEMLCATVADVVVFFVVANFTAKLSVPSFFNLEFFPMESESSFSVGDLFCKVFSGDTGTQTGREPKSVVEVEPILELKLSSFGETVEFAASALGISGLVE
jgi:hypothetical protein